MFGPLPPQAARGGLFPTRPRPHKQWPAAAYSHSIVPGGLLVMS